MADDTAGSDPEIEAITAVYNALKGLQPDAQERVVGYVIKKLNVSPRAVETRTSGDPLESQLNVPESPADMSSEHEGISPMAVKWMRRSGIRAQDLSKCFSVGGDEIELVASSVPGKGKKERMHNVALL